MRRESLLQKTEDLVMVSRRSQLRVDVLGPPVNDRVQRYGGILLDVESADVDAEVVAVDRDITELVFAEIPVSGQTPWNRTQRDVTYQATCCLPPN